MQGFWCDHPYLEQFVEKLNPHLKHLERKLSTALPDHYPDKQIGDPDGDLTSLIDTIETTTSKPGLHLCNKSSSY
jgi:hypothetical protein